MAAYGSAIQAPFFEGIWVSPLWINPMVALRQAAGSLINLSYVNRKYHAGTSTYFSWRSDGSPDPTMATVTPPHPKNQYTDHVVVQVIEAA